MFRLGSTGLFTSAQAVSLIAGCRPTGEGAALALRAWQQLEGELSGNGRDVSALEARAGQLVL